MTRPIRFEGRVPAALALVSLAMLLPCPAWANNPDYQGLRYLILLWPVGAVLSLVLTALAIAAWRSRQPSRRFGGVLIVLSATVILTWPYVVYTMGLGFAPRHREDDLIALIPPLVAALAGLMAGQKAQRKSRDTVAS